MRQDTMRDGPALALVGATAIRTFLPALGMLAALALAAVPGIDDARPGAGSAKQIIAALQDGTAPAASGLHVKLSLIDARIGQYRAKLEENAKLWPVWAELGDALLDRSRLTGAIADQLAAEEALRRSLAVQRNPIAWRWLGALRLDQHRFPEAAAFAKQAIAAWDADGIARAVLSDALIAMGEFAEAEAVFADRPADFYSMAARSRLLFLTNKPDAAIAVLGDALERLGASSEGPVVAAKAWCFLMIGGYHYELNRPEQAKAYYLRALALEPERIDIQEHLAEWEAVYGSAPAAVGRYRSILASQPRPQEKIALGNLLIAQGAAEEGKALVQEAIAIWRQRLDAGDVSVRRELALAELDHGGDAAFALELAHADLEIRKDALAYDTLAWALFKTGAVDGARDAMEKALEHGTPLRALRDHARVIWREPPVAR